MSDPNNAASADGWGKPAEAGLADGWGKPPAVTEIRKGAGWGEPPKPANTVDSVIEGVASLSTQGPKATTTDDTEDEVAVPNKHSNLVEHANDQVVEVKLADLVDDVNNPLYSGVSTFEDLGLHPDLLKGLYGMGFQRPSKIQEKALPLLLSNPPRNMIGQSQSGTGKTAAFALTMLSRVNFNVPTTQAICLAPARELARQIMDVIREMGKYTPVTTAFAIKDSVERGSKVDAHIVVGTPGTLNDLIKKRQLDVKDVRIFVLDEADNMLDQQGLGDQSIRVKNFMPKNCQIVLFSATFTENVRQFAVRFAPNANMIKLKVEELSVDGIRQLYMDCRDENHKTEVLIMIYGLLTIGQSIIFVRRKDKAEQLTAKMNAEGHKVVLLHGGLDAAALNLVINFDMPVDASGRPDPETYLHRIGRTGRFGRTGVSINFVHDQRSYEEMKEIQEYLQREIKRVPTDDWEQIEEYLKKAVK
ncbi:RNA helicase required for poly(A+) mRNA export [Blyttiomyces sp. JEL0837]|nr:RNA helicase required for poly(A+) mRNA export [Blyttiomyces sp. JEL0837]